MKKAIGTFVMVCGFLFAQNLLAQSVTGTNTISDEKAQIDKTGLSIQKGSGFIDSNSDGLCDNRNIRGDRSGSFIDLNNDGICDNRANRSGKRNGRNFVDANNDGVCDNFTNGRNGRGFGRGTGKCDKNGQGFRHRNGQK